MSLGARAAADASTAARYQALIRVSEALGACHERDLLFTSLARELRRVVNFSFLGVAIYDEHAHTMEPHVLEPSGEPITPPQLAADESLTYWVVQHQQPLIIPDIEAEVRFPKAMAYMRSQDIRTTCSLPLTTPQRRLGMLVTGDRQPHSYDTQEVTFLSLVANQVALAIDDALNYDALQQALLVERERAHDLVASDELLRALSTVLDIRDVFPRISEIAKAILPHDWLTLTFNSEESETVLQASSEIVKLSDAPWWAVSHEVKDVPFAIIEDFESEKFPASQSSEFWNQIRSAGYRSALFVRLKAHEQEMGLQFWAKRPRAFDVRQVSVAQRIADHVTLAISHQELAKVEREAAEARLRAERLETRVKSLSDELAAKSIHGRMVGPSAEWQAVLKAATQVAATDSTVLLIGESGTGKEVVARFVHRASNREAGPFIALNCAALPEQLLESELFGYERGAFTGAQQAKPGQIELAAGGVLFLDEVSEMSSSVQAKFLRVLQEREFQRLGGTRILKANVRVVAATNRDLKKAMERGDFRPDLFYRLQVFDIQLPPLRNRTSDILPLSEVFLEELCQIFGRPPAGLTREAKDLLLQYHWPGNVRELRNALERAAILCDGGLITAEHFSLKQEPATTLHGTAGAPITDLNTVEHDMIIQALSECRGNKSKAAARLGLSRTQLYVRLRKYQIS